MGGESSKETERSIDTSTSGKWGEVGSSIHGLQLDIAESEAASQMKMREISRMDQAIRNKLHHGVQYNMKILLCGARGTGKTLLWRRLQGQPFSHRVIIS